MLNKSAMRRRLTLGIVLFLLLAGIFIIAFHHHDEDGDHHDCPICIAGHLASSGIINCFILLIFYATIVSIVSEQALFITWILPFALCGRSPPA